MQAKINNNVGRVYRGFIKRSMDVILSFLALITLSPILLIVAIFVRLKLGKPILFKQKRPGLHAKIFTLYKFRTMTDERDEKGELLPDHLRLTKFGRFLRSTSLDELPELFNIFRGDMSFVGPRPLLVKYIPLYTIEERRRHEVRPGLTGLAQIEGRNTLSWEDRFRYDIKYIESISFCLDLKIMMKTIYKVIRKQDVLLPWETEDFDDYRIKQLHKTNSHFQD